MEGVPRACDGRRTRPVRLSRAMDPGESRRRLWNMVRAPEKMSEIEVPGAQPPPRPGGLRRWLYATAVVAFLVVLALVSAGEPPPEGGHIGFWSLLPALCTLALVFLT